jgi:predicted GIY-YIG superfamily endonuclease
MISHVISASEGRWIVYILQCADMTLYTGITNDLDARMLKHANGTGAKYTRGRGPYEVILTEYHPTKSAALKRELAIKKLSRNEKLALKNDE